MFFKGLRNITQSITSRFNSPVELYLACVCVCVCAVKKKIVNIPTITTARGSAKPESVANLNACHLLRHGNEFNRLMNNLVNNLTFVYTQIFCHSICDNEQNELSKKLRHTAIEKTNCDCITI